MQLFQRVECDRLSLFGGLCSERYSALFDTPESGPSGEPVEGFFIGSRHPCLGAETQDFGEQRRPPVGIEMSGNFIEKQDRAGALLPFRQQLGMGQD